MKKYDLALLFLRVSISAMMLVHGISKLKNPQSYVNFIEANFGLKALSMPLAFASIAAETVFPLFVMLGILVRVSAFVSAVNMMVAVVWFHILIKGDPFFSWEKAALYAIVFLYLTAVGGGRYSILKVARP